MNILKRYPNPLKGRYMFGNFQRPVFSLGVSHHKQKITNLWKFGLNRSSKLRENDERKNTLVGRISVLSDRNKRLLATLVYTINSSPMVVTKSVSKLIFVLSNNQTCNFPLNEEIQECLIVRNNTYFPF